MGTEDGFFDEVIESRHKENTIPENVSSELIEKITTIELVNLLNEFSFCSAEVSLADDDSIFSVTVGLGKVLFFSNSSWSVSHAEDFVGLMVTLPQTFDVDFVSKFNQNTKIGRLYTINQSAGATVYRVDLHLTGGVSKRNIYYIIKTFIECYEHLYASVVREQGKYAN